MGTWTLHAKAEPLHSDNQNIPAWSSHFTVSFNTAKSHWDQSSWRFREVLMLVTPLRHEGANISLAGHVDPSSFKYHDSSGIFLFLLDMLEHYRTYI